MKETVITKKPTAKPGHTYVQWGVAMLGKCLNHVNIGGRLFIYYFILCL